MHTIGRTLIAAALVALAVAAPVASGGTRENMGITAVEIAQLPRFCWGQMEVPNSVGRPEFNFPNNCGPGMNHYCPGLVKLIRAKSASGKGKPLSLLRGAADDVRYTEFWMKDYPSCGVRPHVEASKAEINNLLRMYGGTPAKPPGTP
jgi:hypothetical protein